MAFNPRDIALVTSKVSTSGNGAGLGKLERSRTSSLEACIESTCLRELHMGGTTP